MFRIDSEGATIDNKFTEGDPGLGVPATVVSADWLNDTVQEELCTFVELMDIALSKVDNTQFQQAMLEFFLRGGRENPISHALANNAGPVDVTGYTFDKTVAKAKICLFTIERKTDTKNVQETGTLFITYDSADDEWKVSAMSVHGDADTVFSAVLDVGNVSKLQVTTGDLTGTTYVGNLSITSIFDIRV